MVIKFEIPNVLNVPKKILIDLINSHDNEENINKRKREVKEDDILEISIPKKIQIDLTNNDTNNIIQNTCYYCLKTQEFLYELDNCDCKLCKKCGESIQDRCISCRTDLSDKELRNYQN